MTYPIVSINQEHLCGPLLYLLKHKQQLDGSFKEDNPVYAAAMTVSHVSLTQSLIGRLPLLAYC